MEATTLSTILSTVTQIFESVIGMVGTVATTIIGNPILLMFALIPVVGLGVGLFKRLINVN